MYDIIIIGAGTAGLTAGIYARRSNKKVLILEANAPGGQIIKAANIENYPGEANISGVDFANKIYNQTQDLGAEIVFEKVIDIKNYDDHKEVVTNNNTYSSKALIIATGSENRKLGLDNEKELIGKGVSYCASCDGAFFKEKDVAVIGGGDTALDDALYLSGVAHKVYLIHRNESFRGEISELEQIKSKENVEIITNTNVTKLNGKDILESIEIVDKDGNQKTISVSGIFIAVGMIPENENFSKLIDMDDKGYIISGEDCHTNIEGIYTAGDNRTKQVRQLVTAASDGANAAIEAIKYINSKR